MRGQGVAGDSHLVLQVAWPPQEDLDMVLNCPGTGWYGVRLGMGRTT